METKKEVAKRLLGESFLILMQKVPFEKITIKMITDEAGMIRPTFYNYYQDKYELMEWLLEEKVLRNVRELLNLRMMEEAVKTLFVSLAYEREYYKKVFAITGQNSFEEIFTQHLKGIFLDIINTTGLKKIPDIEFLDADVVASYYALGVTTLIQYWLLSDNEELTAEKVFKIFQYMINHSIFDLLDSEEK